MTSDLAKKTLTYWRMGTLLRNPGANESNRVSAEAALEALAETEISPRLRNRLVEVVSMSKKHRKAS